MGEGETSGTTFQPMILDSGFHEISVYFYEDVFFDGIELWWLKPGADSSDIPYYGTDFHDIDPTFNPNTNWEIILRHVLYTVPDTVTGIDITTSQDVVPVTIQLKQNFPNPFNPQTTIEYILPRAGFVTLRVYTISGQLVSDLISQVMPAGSHTVRWNAGRCHLVQYLSIEAEQKIQPVCRNPDGEK